MELKQFKAEGPAVKNAGYNELTVLADTEQEAQRIFGRVLDQPEDRFDVIQKSTPSMDENPLSVVVLDENGDPVSFREHLKEMKAENIGWGLFEVHKFEYRKYNPEEWLRLAPHLPSKEDREFFHDEELCGRDEEEDEDMEQGFIEAWEHYTRNKLDETTDKEIRELARKWGVADGWEEDGESIPVEEVYPDNLRDVLSCYEEIGQTK